MEHVDALAFDSPNGTSILRRGPITNVLEKSDDGGQSFGGLVTPTWLSSRSAFAFAVNRKLTSYRDYPAAITPMGITTAIATDDALIEGGGVASQVAVGQIFSKSICENPKTGIYHADIDGHLCLGQSVAEFGLCNAALTHFIATALITTTPTWVVRTDAANTPTTAFGDANEHIFGYDADGTNLSFFVDESFIGSFAQSGINSDEPYYPFMICTGPANSIAIQQIGYGFI